LLADRTSGTIVPYRRIRDEIIEKSRVYYRQQRCDIKFRILQLEI